MLSNEPSTIQASAPAGGPSPSLRANALAILGCIFAIAVASYLSAAQHLALDRNAIIAATALLLLIFALVVNGLHRHGFERFGFANTVTAIRAAIVSLIPAAVFYPDASQSISGAPWTFAAAVLVALALDGVDGYLARRYGQESDLGARFDMEIDALLIFCLAAAAFLLGKAGAWVLIIGLMRYAFLLAQYPVPRLAGALPPSLRRKFVCVVQVGVLCVILVPSVALPLSSWLAAIALVLLAYSFAIDCLYLLSEAEGDE